MKTINIRMIIAIGTLSALIISVDAQALNKTRPGGDKKENIRDRAEDRADRRENVRDRKEDLWDARHDGGIKDKIEDRLDRQEDVRDRREDIRDRREDVMDRVPSKVKRERLDVNDDGKVTKEEIKEFRTAGKEAKGEIRDNKQDLISEFKAEREALRTQYDTDRDGKLSKEEWQAARPAFESLRKEHMQEIKALSIENKDIFRDFIKSYGESDAAAE
ncbi:MAG: EF-hand domain-containing protein [Victivallales bacterium]